MYHFFPPWIQDQLPFKYVLHAVVKQQRLSVQGSPRVLPWPPLVLEHLPHVLHGALHRGVAVSALWDSVLGPRVGVTTVTLRTAVSWTLLGVTQGTLAVAMRVQGMMSTLAVAMRVQGMMRPFLGSLWVP